MAGAGYKTFLTGDVLTADDTQTFFMDQVVTTFATTTARDAAITAPQEGQFSYSLADNAFYVYNGTTWVTFDIGWTTYTPTLTNITLGDGTVSAKYVRIGKLVNVQVQFTMGSTSAVTGLIGVSLPVAFVSANRFVGTCRASVVINYMMHVIGSGTNMNVYAVSTSGAYAATTNTSATVPNTWANTHQFFINATYEIA